MHFCRKCWFDLFKEQFIFLLNFGQNYFVQLRWNWFSVRLPVTNAWNCHSLYTAFSSNVGAWGMWACSLFLPYLQCTCAATRAIHIEIVQNLTEPSLMLAFRRFASRTSLPRTLISDNALTFIAPSREIHKLTSLPEILQTLNREFGVTWKIYT